MSLLPLVVLSLVLHFGCAGATLGVDMSQQECAAMAESDWQCLVNSGYDFSIIQTFRGGYQFNNDILTCVNNAWNAGMSHVDVYMFMCPNCDGNNPPDQVVEKVIWNLGNMSVRYGMLWFDIEQCSGCWNDPESNAEWLTQAVNAAINLGVHVGIYSSDYEWGATVGTFAGFSSLPLWYAHYDDQPNFDDTWAFSFGGWTQPSIKQYFDSGPCSSVDVNWYP
jgi:GH25 family lysozyme M1 (1,4-beta-N-acetylmuramidase)